MIWATVSSQSCFCWLYRNSPSLAAKNIINLILVLTIWTLPWSILKSDLSLINLISVLTIWWCPCVESSLVLLKEGVYNDQHILLAKLYSVILNGLPWKQRSICHFWDFIQVLHFCDVIWSRYLVSFISCKKSVKATRKINVKFGSELNKVEVK